MYQGEERPRESRTPLLPKKQSQGSLLLDKKVQWVNSNQVTHVGGGTCSSQEGGSTGAAQVKCGLGPRTRARACEVWERQRAGVSGV